LVNAGLAGAQPGALASVASFGPRSVEGLVLDLDGDKGLTTANVNRLYDATPNAHTATQDTSSKRPAIVENDSDFNGHNSLSFDGVDDFLTSPDSADFELDTGLTIYVVAKAPLQSALHVLVDKRNTGATSQSWSLYTDTSGSLKFSTRNAANTANYVKGTGTTDFDGTVKVYRGRHAASGSTGVRVDSAAELTAAAGDEVASSASSLNIASNNASGSGLLDGKVARILIYKESIADGSTADLAIMAELDALYKGVGSSTGLDFSTEGNLVADFNPDTGAGLATTAWADQQVATPYDFSKTVTAQQPGYTASDAILNGHGSVNFDGAASNADNLVSVGTDPLRPAGGFMIVLVGKFTPPASSFKSVSVKWSGGAANRYWQLRLNSSGTLQALIRNSADTSWQTITTTGTIPGTGLDVIMMGWDGASTGVVLVGGTEETWSVAGAYDAGTAQSMALGRVGSDSAQMDVARVLGYDQPVSASDRARLLAYLKARYGI